MDIQHLSRKDLISYFERLFRTAYQKPEELEEIGHLNITAIAVDMADRSRAYSDCWDTSESFFLNYAFAVQNLVNPNYDKALSEVWISWARTIRMLNQG